MDETREAVRKIFEEARLEAVDSLVGDRLTTLVEEMAARRVTVFVNRVRELGTEHLGARTGEETAAPSSLVVTGVRRPSLPVPLLKSGRVPIKVARLVWDIVAASHPTPVPRRAVVHEVRALNGHPTGERRDTLDNNTLRAIRRLIENDLLERTEEWELKVKS